MMKDIARVFIEEEKLLGFEEKLRENNSKKSLERLLQDSIFVGIAIALFASAILLLTKTNVLYIIAFCLFAFFSPLLAQYFFHSFVFEQNKRKKELLVPDVLLQASVFPCNTPMQKIINYLAVAEYGLLSKEFEKAAWEIKRGAPIEQALLNIKQRCNSRIIDRVINLLIQGYKSGAEMAPTFKDAAEDILETQNILRERAATMVIEKYTLLFAGGLIVPAILGLLVGLVKGMNFSAINSTIGIGLSAAERKSVLDAAMLGNQFYIVEYAIIASLFVATQEGNNKKAILYALFLLPLSFAAYTIAKG